MNIRLNVLMLIVFSTFWSLTATAGGHQNKERKGPPQAAIEACESLNADDACNFTNPKGKAKEGTCAVTRDDVLTCRAKGHKGKGGKKKGKEKNNSDSDSDSDSDDNAAK